jgi:D-alanyl-D-alanine carboxypeptidase
LRNVTFSLSKSGHRNRLLRVLIAGVVCCTSISVGRAEDLFAAKSHRKSRGTVNSGAVDYLSINATRELSIDNVGALTEFFSDRNIRVGVVRQGTIDLASVRRKSKGVQTAPDGHGFPLIATALDSAAAKASIGIRSSRALGRDEAVMSASSAGIRGARVGDRLTLIGWNGSRRTIALGAIAPDNHLLGSEIVISIPIAKDLSFSRTFGMRAWGFRSRGQIEDVSQKLKKTWSGQRLRTRYSWASRNGGPVSQIRMKKLLGEFAIRRLGDGQVTIDKKWLEKNVGPVDMPIIGSIRCHKKVGAAAARALRELKGAGLAKLINVGDTRGSGGCFNARTTRSASGNAGQTLSRHAWGAAIDINPSRNRYGGTSHMDPRVIAAFRRQGFVWGGNFLTPDPMHFEYVG